MCVMSEEIKPGDIVLTTYGVAVVVKTYQSEGNNTSSFKARLWRIPSKSIVSSATAYLQSNCVIKTLPAAPGMVSFEINSSGEEIKEVLIHCYSPHNDTYVVSHVQKDSFQRIDIVTSLSRDESDLSEESTSILEFFELKPNYIKESESAKFYPLIDELIQRGNEASNATKNIVKDATILRKEINNEKKEKISIDTEKIIDTFTKSVPDSHDVKNIYTMLKDEELTTLLEKGRQRLEQLTSGGLSVATESALNEMGVMIDDDTATPTLLAKAQEQALQAIDELLAENLNVSLDSMKTSVGSTFATMFDSFSTAAHSDGTLNSVLSQINEKTSEWQQQTGRLMETKSSALFFEGAQRIQSRVGNILSPQLLEMSKQSRASLTKAFTEGDIALAKLKSLELGDSIRSRLFDAIEARSESLGGLDAIIAGAVAQTGGQSIIESIKKHSSTLSLNSNETLIALLSERSKYHDMTLLHLEQTLVHLNSHFDDGISAEQLANIARGEGGTSALFEPIAKKATKEIERQLQIAEESISDPTVLAVISNVRRIMSGDLTMTNLFDEVANILNNDEVVNVGVTMAQRGEQFLDAIETASENKTVSDLIVAAEQAGVTKDTLIGQIEALNMEDILDTAEQAVKDEQKRVELLSSATDSALDFLLRILPAMPIPPFEGVRDGMIYSIENLSMKGFRLRKEDISVEIAGIKASQQSNSSSIIVPDPVTGNDVSFRDAKSTDVLIIDVRNISALFEDALWKFEKTSFPFVKTDGTANVDLSDGTIRLEFDLRKKRTDSKTWEPVLCLHNRICSIGRIDLTIDGAKGLSWVVNKLATIFRGPLRNYVVKVILDILTNRSGWLLQNLNGLLSPHWDLILKTIGIGIDDLEEANENDIIAETLDPTASELDLVWNEFVPLGINLIVNDKSGLVKVKDFPRGSQARQVASKKGIDPGSLSGATIIAVNGKHFNRTERKELIQALREPERPKTIKFKLPSAVRESLKSEPDIPDGIIKNQNLSLKSLTILNEGPIGIEFSTSLDNFALAVKEFQQDGLAQAANAESNIKVGDILVAVNDSQVIKGSGPWIQMSYESLQRDGLSRPLRLDFLPPYLYKVQMNANECDLQSDGPGELILTQKKISSGASRVFLEGFEGVDGAAESSGVIIGDNLIFINGMPVGAGTKLRPGLCPILELSDVNAILNDKRSYPACLHFARQASSGRKKVELDVESEDMKSFPVTVSSLEQLGCSIQQFGLNPSMKFVVDRFFAVNGYFGRTISSFIPPDAMKHLSFYSINGEMLPSYANSDMVMNALKRGWKSGQQLEIVFCNEITKEQLIGK